MKKCMYFLWSEYIQLTSCSTGENRSTEGLENSVVPAPSTKPALRMHSCVSPVGIQVYEYKDMCTYSH